MFRDSKEEFKSQHIFDENNLRRLVFCLLPQNAKTLLQKSK